MRIIVLHGNDTEKSYSRLKRFIEEAKGRSWRVTDFDFQKVENQSLFAEKYFFILRNYKLLDRKAIEKLKKYNGNLIVYTTGLHPAAHLKMLNPNKIERFEPPVFLWKFLNNMTVDGLQKLAKTNSFEYILAMIAWKLKQNYLKNPSLKNAKLILDLAEIDIKSKTSDVNLSILLDLFIAKNLK